MSKPKGVVPAKGKRKRDNDAGMAGTSKRSKTKNDDIQDEDDNDMNLSKVDIPALLLANSWKIDGGQDVAGWWMSEKLDGVRQVVLFRTHCKPECSLVLRVFYDGKRFISRLGNPYTAPQWFLNSM